jgi:hypothetical protein
MIPITPGFRRWIFRTRHFHPGLRALIKISPSAKSAFPVETFVNNRIFWGKFFQAHATLAVVRYYLQLCSPKKPRQKFDVSLLAEFGTSVFLVDKKLGGFGWDFGYRDPVDGKEYWTFSFEINRGSKEEYDLLEAAQKAGWVDIEQGT